ncbi:MAG: energy transducer TonB, partial [Pseudomonadota bacterium]
FLKLQPEYPSRALSRGIEGYVDLAFDISSTGATSNIRVVDAEPEGVFERAAIRALERWKYKVPITKGVPQGQVDMMTRLRFELE